MLSGSVPSAEKDPFLVMEYLDEGGYCAWSTFFDSLSATAAAKVAGVVEKLARGHKSGLKGLGAGLAEWRLDWGPGVRIYLHEHGDRIILLMGGSYGKTSQSADIAAAQDLLAGYKRRTRASAVDHRVPSASRKGKRQ